MARPTKAEEEMTESSTTSKVQYSGDGVTVSFTTGFKFALDADVTVILTSAASVETTWTNGTQYTLVGAGLGVNGTVTVKTTPTDYTPASGTTLTIKRVPALTQTMDLPLGGALQSSNIENALDRNVHMMQAISESVDRSLKLSETSTETASVMPDLSGNVGKYLEVNTGETGYSLVTPVSGAVIATPVSIAQGGTAGATAAAARTNLGLAIGTNVQAFNAYLADIAGLSPAIGNILYFDGTDFVVLAAGTDGYHLRASGAAAPVWEAVTANRIVQVVNVQDGAVATGTTVLPNDDTIPQNTEGDQYMSLAITPTNTNNKLLIEVVVIAAGGVVGAAQIGVGLFQDTTAGALAASSKSTAVQYHEAVMSFKHYMTAGTVSATTFKVRVGTSAAGTTTFNGANAARRMGGVMASSITITEITV